MTGLGFLQNWFYENKKCSSFFDLINTRIAVWEHFRVVRGWERILIRSLYQWVYGRKFPEFVPSALERETVIRRLMMRILSQRRRIRCTDCYTEYLWRGEYQRSPTLFSFCLDEQNEELMRACSNFDPYGLTLENLCTIRKAELRVQLRVALSPQDDNWFRVWCPVINFDKLSNPK